MCFLMVSCMSNQKIFEIDLTKVDSPNVPCPKCGNVFYPDDESEDSYIIIETKVEEEKLKEIIVNCRKCGSNVRLTGF